MKKTKILLSLVMLFGLTVSVFAEKPYMKDKDCFIPPPQFQEREIIDEDGKIDIFDTDMGYRGKNYFKYHKKHFNKKRFEKKFADLNLTDKQKEDLKALKKDYRKIKYKLVKEFNSKTKKLNEEYFKEKYNDKEIKSITKDLKELSAKIIDTDIEKKDGMRKILTAEQYNKLFKPKTHYDRLAERIGLSEEQKEKFTKILESKREKEQDLRKQLNEKEFSLRQEFDKENIDKKAITKLSDEISKISKDLYKLDVDTKIELKSILSPEQYKRYIQPRPGIIYEPTRIEKNIDKR